MTLWNGFEGVLSPKSDVRGSGRVLRRQDCFVASWCTRIKCLVGGLFLQERKEGNVNLSYAKSKAEGLQVRRNTCIISSNGDKYDDLGSCRRLKEKGHSGSLIFDGCNIISHIVRAFLTQGREDEVFQASIRVYGLLPWGLWIRPPSAQ